MMDICDSLEEQSGAPLPQLRRCRRLRPHRSPRTQPLPQRFPKHRLRLCHLPRRRPRLQHFIWPSSPTVDLLGPGPTPGRDGIRRLVSDLWQVEDHRRPCSGPGLPVLRYWLLPVPAQPSGLVWVLQVVVRPSGREARQAAIRRRTSTKKSVPRAQPFRAHGATAPQAPRRTPATSKRPVTTTMPLSFGSEINSRRTFS